MKPDRREREAEWLTARGFDGLYHPDPVMECGCFVGDLYPCGERPRECRPGHVRHIGEVAGIFPPLRKARRLTSQEPTR